MSDDKYLTLVCDNCDSTYCLEFTVQFTNLKPQYCPFCGEDFEDEMLDEDFNEDED